jgi:hypothetical protein
MPARARSLAIRCGSRVATCGAGASAVSTGLGSALRSGLGRGARGGGLAVSVRGGLAGVRATPGRAVRWGRSPSEAARGGRRSPPGEGRRSSSGLRSPCAARARGLAVRSPRGLPLGASRSRGAASRPRAASRSKRGRRSSPLAALSRGPAPRAPRASPLGASRSRGAALRPRGASVRKVRRSPGAASRRPRGSSPEGGRGPRGPLGARSPGLRGPVRVGRSPGPLGGPGGRVGLRARVCAPRVEAGRAEICAQTVAAAGTDTTLPRYAGEPSAAGKGKRLDVVWKTRKGHPPNPYRGG